MADGAKTTASAVTRVQPNEGSRAGLGRVNAYITVERVDGELKMRCRCGTLLGPAEDDYKDLSLEARYPVQRAGPFANPYELGESRFELREYYCPNCLVLYETDVAMVDDPNVHDVELDMSALVG